MKTILTIAEMRQELAGFRAMGHSIGLVPTMGALHEGHRSLVDASVSACDVTVASVFVNPAQFGPHEDYQRYPRTFEADQAMLEAAGCQFLFAPDVAELYPDRTRVWVTPETEVADGILCGAHRPGHFRGVLTVVAKLFNIVQPTHALFGQKDFQQAWLIRRMVADLDLPIIIKVAPTVRESDGLALSSRNRYLSSVERQAATVLYRALEAGRLAILEGETDAPAVEAVMHQLLATESTFTTEYAEVRDAATLAEASSPLAGEVILAIAGKLGSTRLIDNELVIVPVSVSTGSVPLAEGAAYVS